MRNSNNKKIISFRVDASSQIGYGHIYRCISIAKNLNERNYKGIFFCNYDSTVEVLKEIVTKELNEVILIEDKKDKEEEVEKLSNIAAKNKTNILVSDINNRFFFDSYNDYWNYLEKLKKSGFAILSFEEFEDFPYRSDKVVIPYFGAESVKLTPPYDDRYLIGHKYFVFRKEFVDSNKCPIHEKVKSILISMGGSDPWNYTEKILTFMSKMNFNIDLNIVLGNGNKLKDKEINCVLREYNGTYSIIRNSNEMSDLMINSDIAVLNSGLTKYESSLLGLPALTISNNKEHEQIMNAFAEHGSIIHMGLGEDLSYSRLKYYIQKLVNDHDLRLNMSKSGQKLFDGKGCDRIVNEIEKIL